MESPENQITLKQIPLGGRLLIRSKTTWRVAVVTRIVDDKFTLSVSSPRGRNYRLRRLAEASIGYDGKIPILVVESTENWRDNFSIYDFRW